MRRLKKLGYLAALCAVCFLGSTEVKAEKEPIILNGVFIGEVDVSGLNKEDAIEKVNKFIEDCQDDILTLHMNGNSFKTTVEPFAYTWTNEDVVSEALQCGKDGNIIMRYKQKCDLENNPVSLTLETAIDEEATAAVLEENCTQYDKEVEEYGLTTEDGEVVLIGGHSGVSLDVEASTTLVKEYLTTQWAGGEGDIDLEVTIKEPKMKAEDFEEMTDVLGAGSTSYKSSSENRKENIKNGTSKVHGTILYPGESFSMLDACLPFTEKNGYKPAGSYEGGMVVDSLGGGICQVSTTLYLAVMRSELQVDRRHNHSMLVTYVKPSMDAAIAEGTKDFKFTNNTDSPIYIEGTANGSEVAFTIYGKDTRDEDREVRFVSETLSSDNPKVSKRARLWKIVTVDGEETKTQFNSSTYYKTKKQLEEEEAARLAEEAAQNEDYDEDYNEDYEDNDDD